MSLYKSVIFASILALLLTVITVSSTISDRDSLPHHGRCEAITIPLCKDILYNETIFPNLLNHQKQEDAGLEVHQFYPLVKVKCSPDLQIFLCSVYAPVCTVLDKPIPPCRSLCLSARSGCEGLMNKFGFQWPESLECSRYPEGGAAGELCVGENNTSSGTSHGGNDGYRPPYKVSGGLGGVPNYPRNPLNELGNYPGVYPGGPSGSVVGGSPTGYGAGSNWYGGPSGIRSGFTSVNSNYSRDHGFICPAQFRVPKGLDYVVRVGGKVYPDCGAPCKGMFFNESEVRFSRVWIVVWGAICMASCLFTVLTFLLDVRRFRYPERPVVFLSVCYFMVALAYVIGYAMGDSVSCNAPFDPPQDFSVDKADMVETITQGTKRESCTILFMLLYYFEMAANLWWVVLTLTWFLAAGLKWGHEPIEAKSHYFHLVTWALPAALTIAILAMGKVEGDVLSGVCSVGIWDMSALRLFVLAPLFLFLIVGTIFLLGGFISLFRVRTLMKSGGTKTDKLEKFMLRIGIYSFLYTVPAIIVIACLLHEQAFFDSWMLRWQEDKCRDPQWIKFVFACPSQSLAYAKGAGGYPTVPTYPKPEFAVFMIKYLMMLIVGISSGFWVMSSKTLATWSNFYRRLFWLKPEPTGVYV